jgi:Rod binding domain-containing protein
MTTVPNSASALLKTSDKGLQSTSAATGGASNEATSEKISQAARDFETVFLRQMLSALERTTKVGDKGPSIPGQQAYGSMIVEAVADAVAQAGGIGLGQVLSKALASKTSLKAADDATTPSAPAPAKKEVAPTDNATNSPQGLMHRAVPITEIRTSASQRMGQLADRRIR